jgi:murein DD-endopeptidase MepM/ murein hydrolase activator NlpD
MRLLQGRPAARTPARKPRAAPPPRAERERRDARAARVSRAAFTAAPLARALALLLKAARNPLVASGLAVSALVLILAPSLGLAGLRLPQGRPALPAPADLDPALYDLLVPETARATAGAVNPVILSSLNIASYTTQAGDSLSRIAARYKLAIDTVVSWNDIHDARNLATGTRLSIPNADGLKYTVRRGDTLEGIARSSGVELNSILDWNRLGSSVITVGQELFLPGARLSPEEMGRVLGSLFIYPVQGRISSFFGERADPFNGTERFHNGVDIVNRPGTPVLAAMVGSVGSVGWNANYGYFVILKHSGYQTLYGHLMRYMVKKGQTVRQGEKIGELGTTGYSTGPHLHFSIFKSGQPVDPLRFLK